MEGILGLDRLLKSGGCYTLDELSERLEASTRTVERYIRELRDQNAFVVFDDERRAYRYASEGLALPATKLRDDEILALYLAAPILAQYRGTPLEAEFEAAFDRLTSGLPERVRQRLQPVAERVAMRASVPAREDIERFRTVLRATLEEHRIAMTYFSAHSGATSNRLVDPYGLYGVGGEWYLIGYCHERKDVLAFHVGRIWSATDSGKSFQRPKDFELEAYTAEALGIFRPPAGKAETEQVRIRFDAFAARFVRERVWHPSQSIEEREGGEIVMSMRLGSFVELERFVLGWCEHAEVLAPEKLRERIAVRLDGAVKPYQGLIASSRNVATQSVGASGE